MVAGAKTPVSVRLGGWGGGGGILRVKEGRASVGLLDLVFFC